MILVGPACTLPGAVNVAPTDAALAIATAAAVAHSVDDGAIIPIIGRPLQQQRRGWHLSRDDENNTF